jgi:gamma-glutamyltranspeptidase/glutathione hydrolase
MSTPSTGLPRPDCGGRSTVYGTAGIVACEHPLAALEGIRALDDGGTAADACVAMAAVLAVVAPMMTGLGGDAFLLWFDPADGRVRALEGAGRAGAEANPAALRAQGLTEMPASGGAPVTVPGAVRLWEDAVAQLGRLSLRRLLEPARALAERGFAVSEVTARQWQEGAARLAGDTAAAASLLPGGRAPRAGELVRRPDLSATLGTIADSGARVMYEGPLGERIVAAVQRTGGFLTQEDLSAHRSTWVEPLATDYRGLRVHELPPPTQGLAVLLMLNRLADEDLGALDPLSAERIHLEVEAKRAAFAVVQEAVGDPDHVDVPVAELLAGRGVPRDAPTPAASGDTTYLCAVDRAGRACSFINSLYEGFGSGVMVPNTGICLHNRGRGFRLDEGHPAELGPGRRPFHTLIPGLVTEGGALWGVLGVMGAFMQPQGHVQVLVNLHDFGMTPQDALDHPRHRSYDDGVLVVEGRVPERERERLRSWGHDVQVGPDYALECGSGQLVRMFDGGVRAGASDARKDGCALAQC